MKYRRPHIITAIILLWLTAGVLQAQQNPFLSREGASSEAPEQPRQREDAPPPAPEEPSSDQAESLPETKARRNPKQQGPLLRWSAQLQREIYGRLAESMQRVKDSDARSGFMLLLLAGAFLYGAVHAIGPGHRKTVLFSYFMAEEAPLKQGIFAGVLMGLLHGAAAAAIILPLYYLLRGSLLLTFNEFSRSLEVGTFMFIALFGAVMLIITVVQLVRGHRGHREYHGYHGPKGGEKNDGGPRRGSRARTLMIIIGSSLVPCPGAAMVLLFALSMQMVGVSLWAVLSMSLGMSFTLALVAFLTLRARSAIECLGKGRGRSGEILHHGLEVGGYLVITVFGLIMTLGAL